MIFGDEEEARIGVLKEISCLLCSHPGESVTPAFMGTERERILKMRSGLTDPHADVKMRSNEVAKALLPVAVEYFTTHSDGVEALVRIAAAANSMEYGVKGYAYDDDAFRTEFMKVLNERLNWNRDSVLSAISKHDKVLYLTDNAGEVFFDAFVVKKLAEMGKKVVVSPKSGAIINDATVTDWREAAAYVDVPSTVDIVPAASCIGVSREDASEEFLHILNDDEYLVIAKGMGNYEAISEFEQDYRQRLIYILRAKCMPVARSIGVNRGELVAKLV